MRLAAVVLLAALQGTSARAATPPAAPERTGAVRVLVTPDRDGWTYGLGEPVTFQVRVQRDGHAIAGAKITYEIGPELLPPTHKGEADVPPEGLALEAPSLAEPGFLRCVVETEVGGRKYRGLATAGIAPDEIKPTVEEPKDFDAFWDEGKKDVAAIPLDAKMTPAPERSMPGATCFHVSVAGAPAGAKTGNRPGPPTPSRLYGILCEPEGPGPFPALLNVPGAGIRSYQGLAGMTVHRQIITFQIGIHGIPVNLDEEVYKSLDVGGLSGYPNLNLDDRKRHYYRRVYLNTVRANDLLTSRPKWDRQNLYVMGGSQGGALSIVTAALDPRVRGLVAFYPALSDHTGFLKGRAGGWPFYFRPEAARTPARLETVPYFDVVNFARRVKVPGFYSWGFNDETCPPTSLYASFNVIRAPKRLVLALETGHHTIAEQDDAAQAFLASLWAKAAPAKRSAPAPKTAPGNKAGPVAGSPKGR